MERFYAWLAYRLPKRLAYWCYVRVHSYATVTEFTDRTPEEVNCFEAMKAWK